MNSAEFIKEISGLAKDFGFEEIQDNGHHLSLLIDYFSGIHFHLLFTAENDIEFYFHHRTQSYVYGGDRTDLHDVISVTFSAFIKMFSKQISPALFDVSHPAVPELDDCEIYARYIIPQQKKLQFNEKSKDGVEEFKVLLASLFTWKHLFWQVVGCPCEECSKEYNPPFEYKIEINNTFKSNILKVLEEKENWNQMARYLPTWEYYKNFDEGVSVVSSTGLATLINSLSIEEKNTFNRLDGVESELIFDDHLKNIVTHTDKKKVSLILKSLKDVNWQTPFFVPLENILVASGKDYLIFIESVGGRYEFKKEKERIKIRHANESKILFPVNEFEWNSKIDPTLFEAMIKELLEREPNVIRVRKVAPLNQPDGGRDLIMEWSEASDFGQDNEKSPYVMKRIIVQCKGYTKSVGKSEVADIRDTVDNYNYDGYFLAVSSQITTPLTDYMDRLRIRGLWIDWWNRDEIEERLSSHRDILEKYRNIVKIKE